MTTRSAWAEPNISRTTGKQIGWTARWEVPGGDQGYKAGPRRGVRFTRKRDAVEYAEDQVAAHRRGLYVPPASGRLTLADVAVPWLALYERYNRPGTVRRYRWALGIILPEWGHVGLDELDGTAMRRWLDSLTPRWSERTVKTSIRSVLGNLLDYCVDERMLAVNPIRRQRIHKRNAPTVEDTPTIVFPTWEQIEATRAALPANMRVLVDLGAFAGLRPGEARGLRLRDVDFLHRQIVVRTALDEDGDTNAPVKTRHSVRVVPVDDDLLQLVNSHIAEVGRGPDDLLAFDRGNPCRDHTVHHHWKRAQAAVGVEFRTNDLRHFYASMLIAHGVPLASVAKYLGHASSRTTERYYHHLVPSTDEQVRGAFVAARAESSRHRRGIGGLRGV